MCARLRGLVARAEAPGESREYCAPEPWTGVRRMFCGEARALRLDLLVDRGGGGPRRAARSGVLETLERER